MIEYHSHRAPGGIVTGLEIVTRTVGQNFGTCAIVRRAAGSSKRKRPTLHTTAVMPLHFDHNAINAARDWIDAQEYIPEDATVAVEG